MITRYKITLNFMALMLSVYGTPSNERGERTFNDDPDECIYYLLNGKWKRTKSGDTGFVKPMPKTRQLTIFDLYSDL